MTAPDPDPAIPPECATTLDLLQRRLDGESVETPADVAAHAAGCRDCRERFSASRLLAAAPAPHEPPVPNMLTERIVVGVLADARRRRRLRRWSLGAVGVAAAVTLAVWLARPTTPVPPVEPAPDLVREQPPPNLREGFVEAGEAVASLTRRTATEAVGPVTLPTEGASWWAVPTLPAARSFDDTGVALADGFEPVATSARRAARLFWRELPLADAKED